MSDREEVKEKTTIEKMVKGIIIHTNVKETNSRRADRLREKDGERIRPSLYGEDGEQSWKFYVKVLFASSSQMKKRRKRSEWGKRHARTERLLAPVRVNIIRSGKNMKGTTLK
jgi:hypothetical protein